MMDECLAWRIMATVSLPHILTEKAAANIRKFAEIRLTDLKNKYLRKNGKPKKLRKAK